MEKFKKNGKTAVLYSPGYGAGWSTWSDNQDIIFDSRIVKKVYEGKSDEITDEFMKSIGYEDVYCGGASDLKIMWIEDGCRFEISEYDGYEAVRIIDEEDFLTA